MLITEDNAVFISSLLDPHAEHLVKKNLNYRDKSPKELGYLNFFLGHFGERNSSKQFWYFNFLDAQASLDLKLLLSE